MQNENYMDDFILKLSKNQLIEIINNQFGCVFILDNTLKVIYVNDFFCSTSGFLKDDIINKKFLYLIDEEYVNAVNNNIVKLFNKNNNNEYLEVKINTKNGNLDVILKMLRINIESEDYVVITADDITSGKALDDILYNKSKEFRDENKIRNNYLMNISHGIRTPINSIIGFVGLLAQENLSLEKKDAYLEIIKSVSSKLLDTVNDITDLSRINENSLKIVKNNFKIIDLINNLKFTYNKQIIESNNLDISLISNVRDESTELMLYSDKFRINQILSNLIDNAIKFSKKGNIIISYEKIEDKLIFSVKDHGIGISKEILKNIFDSFSKSTYQKKQKGKGLGLTLSKKIANLLDGNLYVDSKLGQGSTFYLSLPYEFKENNEDDDSLIFKNIKNYDFKNKKILIVEDEQTNYIFLNEILVKKNAETTWVKNGKQALKLFIENTYEFDLILMDIRMPIMDGIKATKEIRKINKKIPIIAQTAYAMDSEKTKSIEAGCNDFVVKPIKKNILFDKINKLIYKK